MYITVMIIMTIVSMKSLQGKITVVLHWEKEHPLGQPPSLQVMAASDSRKQKSGSKGNGSKRNGSRGAKMIGVKRRGSKRRGMKRKQEDKK